MTEPLLLRRCRQITCPPLLWVNSIRHRHGGDAGRSDAFRPCATLFRRAFFLDIFFFIPFPGRRRKTILAPEMTYVLLSIVLDSVLFSMYFSALIANRPLILFVDDYTLFGKLGLKSHNNFSSHSKNSK